MSCDKQQPLPPPSPVEEKTDDLCHNREMQLRRRAQLARRSSFSSSLHSVDEDERKTFLDFKDMEDEIQGWLKLKIWNGSLVNNLYPSCIQSE